MRIVVPIGRSYIQVGLVGALLLLPIYGLWVCWLLVWYPLKWAVLGTVLFFHWVSSPSAPFKEESKDGSET